MSSPLFKFDFTKKVTPPAQQAPASASTPKPAAVSTAPLGTDKKEMTDEVFNKYRNLIYKLCGIYFTDSKKYLLEGRVIRRLVSHKMRSFEEYLTFVESPAGRNE